MIRSVRLAEEDRRLIDHAARLVSTLGAVERLNALGDDDGVDVILGGVDPVDVRIVAAHLREISALWHQSPIRIGAEPTASRDGSAPDGADAAGAPSSSRSSAPSVNPESLRV